MKIKMTLEPESMGGPYLLVIRCAKCGHEMSCHALDGCERDSSYINTTHCDKCNPTQPELDLQPMPEVSARVDVLTRDGVL